MRLSEFMLDHREQILAEWVTFARSCFPIADTMDLAMLRDHASAMLDTNRVESKGPAPSRPQMAAVEA